MNIQEAIRKAGPGGKIRREGWANPEEHFTIPGNKKRDFIGDGYIKYGTSNVDASFSDYTLLADDWEVVEPEVEIQVGDWVKDNLGFIVQVVEISNGQCCLRDVGGKLVVCELNSVNFVANHDSNYVEKTVSRPDKGKVHVFEDVIWEKVLGDVVPYPYLRGDNRGFNKFAGKRTRVTVEEL